RLVNDYGFHKLTRPMAYQMIDEKLGASRDETGEPLFSDVQEFVRDDLALHLRHTYEEQFQGKRFYAGTRAYEVSDLTDVKIFLPWPRAYEVRLEFRLRARPMSGE
ncbi:MAG: DUF4127 family protein, partial [Fimbriimonas ginsengisoli]|nr:DUF4127 family protein [Fimbriimonas ginsengisoli]